MHGLRTCLFLIACLLVGGAISSAADGPQPPSEKPSVQVTSEVLSDTDARTLRFALKAVEKAQWSRVARYHRGASDKDLKALLVWYRLRGNDPLFPLHEAMEAALSYRDWPSAGTIRKHIEQRLVKDAMISPGSIIAWFDAFGETQTGDGVFVLAQAYKNNGETEKADALIKQAWATRGFGVSANQNVLRVFGDSLTIADHEARADYLLWGREFTAAKKLKPFVSKDWRHLIDARIALGRLRRSGVDRLIKAVPEDLQAHPGLMFERGRWRRRRVGRDAGIEILRGIDGRDVIPSARPRLWQERRLSARQAIKTQDWQAVYDLSAKSGMHTGTNFSASEWMAGWVALQHLNRADDAIAHFNKLRAGVSSPISLARADYWLGRANEYKGESEIARAHYDNAAKHFYTYYGQLAAQKTGQTQVAFAPVADIAPAEKAAFNQRSFVRIIRMLAEAGNTGMVRHFSFHLDDTLGTPEEFTLLSALAQESLTPDAGVRAGKAGLYRHIIAPDAAYPVVDYPFSREPMVEKSLILGLARQESEMNPFARSHAGAVGLMQFLPSTAKIEARRRGMPYRVSWLSDDPSYAITLGGAHLDHLVERFDGSYIMAIASYNAGASRVDQWIETYGDPRTGEIDPIDWIEMIPFSETRNYVQRVIENTQVYRHRLTGEAVKSQTLQDILRYTP